MYALCLCCVRKTVKRNFSGKFRKSAELARLKIFFYCEALHLSRAKIILSVHVSRKRPGYTNELLTPLQAAGYPSHWYHQKLNLALERSGSRALPTPHAESGRPAVVWIPRLGRRRALFGGDTLNEREGEAVTEITPKPQSVALLLTILNTLVRFLSADDAAFGSPPLRIPGNSWQSL